MSVGFLRSQCSTTTAGRMCLNNVDMNISTSLHRSEIWGTYANGWRGCRSALSRKAFRSLKARWNECTSGRRLHRKGSASSPCGSGSFSLTVKGISRAWTVGKRRALNPEREWTKISVCLLRKRNLLYVTKSDSLNRMITTRRIVEARLCFASKEVTYIPNFNMADAAWWNNCWYSS